MDSSQNISSPYFKSLKPLQPSESNPENGDPNIPKGITFSKSILLNNRVILFGKHEDRTKTSKSLWIFDLDTLKWETIEVIGSSLLADDGEGYSVCLAQDHNIILFGCLRRKPQSSLRAAVRRDASINGTAGVPQTYDAYASVEILLTSGSDGMKWVQDQSQDFVPICKDHSANICGDKMYVFGGLNPTDGKATNSLYEYSLSSRCWKQVHTSEKKPGERYGHKTSTCQGNLFIFGGQPSPDQYFNDIWVFDLKKLTWINCTPRTRPFYQIRSSALVSISSRTFLIFGSEQSWNDIFSFNLDSGKLDNLRVQNLPLTLGSCSIFQYKGEFIIQNTSNFYQLSLDLEKLEDRISESSTFNQQMKNLLNENTYYDLKFQVEGKEIPVIKGILAARCPYFAKMFTSGMKESQSEVIDVPDITYEVYYKLINYLYCDQIEFSNKETAVGLLKLSDEYSLSILKTKCAKYLARIVDNENFLDLGILAEQFQAEELEASIVAYFVTFKALILQKYSLKDLPRYLLEGYVLSSM